MRTVLPGALDRIDDPMPPVSRLRRKAPDGIVARVSRRWGNLPTAKSGPYAILFTESSNCGLSKADWWLSYRRRNHIATCGYDT